MQLQLMYSIIAPVRLNFILWHVANRQKAAASNPPSRIKWLDPLVFTQLVAFVKYSSDGVPVKVSDLIKLYKDLLKSLSKDNNDCYIHESRFIDTDHISWPEVFCTQVRKKYDNLP